MSDARIEIEIEDGWLDAYLATPRGPGPGPGPRPPILLLADRSGVTSEVEALARRIAAHGYVVLAPERRRRSAEDLREEVDGWLDYLAGQRSVDDSRVGVAGWGLGADLALRVAAWRAERIAAVAAYGGRGFGPATAREIAQRLNGVVRLGYLAGRSGARIGVLEAALCEAGVDFEIEVCLGTPDWADLADLFGRTLSPAPPLGRPKVKLEPQSSTLGR